MHKITKYSMNLTLYSIHYSSLFDGSWYSNSFFSFCCCSLSVFTFHTSTELNEHEHILIPNSPPIYHSTTNFRSSQCDCIQIRKLMTRFFPINFHSSPFSSKLFPLFSLNIFFFRMKGVPNALGTKRRHWTI